MILITEEGLLRWVHIYKLIGKKENNIQCNVSAHVTVLATSTDPTGREVFLLHRRASRCRVLAHSVAGCGLQPWDTCTSPTQSKGFWVRQEQALQLGWGEGLAPCAVAQG